MKILNFTFETELAFSEPVTSHDFVLRCLPTSTAAQTVLDAQAIVTPPTTVATQTDGFGNALLVGRIEPAHESFSFISSGTVVVETEGARPEEAHPLYLRPSPRCAPGPHLAAFVADVLRVCGNAGALEKARRLSRALFGAMSYEKGVTDVTTTAEEALTGARGVCQDYAHALVALCRAAGVPARYVSGFLLGEGETHAWAEVHDGTRWRGLDPTNDCEVSCDYITLARGRDFADCPVEAGVFLGGARQSQRVRVEVHDDAAWAALGAYGTGAEL